MIKKILLISIIVFLTALVSIAQDSKVEAMRAKQMLHKEQPTDAYLAHPNAREAVSKAYYYRDAMVETHQVNVDANGQNIIGDAANEPSLSIDTANPERIIIGWRQFDNIASNFRQAGYAYSHDGGQSWTFPGSINAGVFRSDPVIDVDSEGTFYYNSLTSNNGTYTCKVFRSYDGGVSWDEGVEAKGGDKQWMVIDRTEGPGRDNNYSFWTMSWTSCYPGNFTRSVNKGESYGPCVAVAGEPYWGTLAVGPDGELYIAGAGWDGIQVSRSNNAKDPLVTTSWEMNTDVYMDGQLSYGANVNPGGLLGQASIAVDHSGTASHGNVYVLASVERYNGDPADVMFARSIDGGMSWSEARRINQDISFTKTQWFGTMSIAPNGRLDAVWLDTRDAPASQSRMSALYYSWSDDQGETWSPNQRISELFDPHIGWPNQEKMGDYFHMISDNQGAHLSWANTLNGGQDVYYTRITLDITATASAARSSILGSVYPNPASQFLKLTYQLKNAADVKISLSDAYGRTVLEKFVPAQGSGTFQESFDIAGLKGGIYFCTLSADNQSGTLKVVIQ